VRKSILLSLAAGVLLAGCAIVPTGPSVMVLPGNGKDLERFSLDDGLCRQWALQRIGATPNQTATDTAVTSAAIGTALGAAGGAALGAAAGNPAAGAAAGAGIGLLGGTAVGADQAAIAHGSMQNRYDIAYMQCMYTKGNQIPVQGTFEPPPSTQSGTNPAIDTPPPPPAGSPPPPPPGVSRY